MPATTPAPPTADAPKQRWRAWAGPVRAAVVDAELSDRIVAALVAWPGFARARHVLTYLAFGSEVDLASLPATEQSERRLYVTRTNRDARLSLHPLERSTLVPHRYGFLQPPAAAPGVEVGTLDLVLAPGLAFDRRGTRLGYGAGLYDRLLAEVAADVPIVGVTTEALLVDRLPREPHDRPMSHLLTECGVVPVGNDATPSR